MTFLRAATAALVQLSLWLPAGAQIIAPLSAPSASAAGMVVPSTGEPAPAPAGNPPVSDDSAIPVIQEPPAPQRPVTDDSGAIYYAPDPYYTDPYYNDGWRWGGTTGWIVAIICIVLALVLGTCGAWVLVSRRKKRKKSYYGLQEEGEIGMVRHDGLTRPQPNQRL